MNAIPGQILCRPQSKPSPYLTFHPTFVLICLYIFCGLSPWMKIVPFASVPRHVKQHSDYIHGEKQMSFPPLSLPIPPKIKK